MAGPLASVLEAIYQFMGSYGWAIVIFTVLVKAVLLPLEYRSRRSMRQVQKLNPKLQALQKKYGSDKEKLNQKTAQLYRQEGISPMAGCLPMLLSMAVLFLMFSAMRQVANQQMAAQTLAYLAEGEFNGEGFLWMQNLWMPDSPFAPALPTARQLAQIPAESWSAAYAALAPQQIAALPALEFDFSAEACAQTVEAIAAHLSAQGAYVEATATVPALTGINLIFTQLSVYTNANGWLLLPLLSCFTQVLMSRLGRSDAQQPAPGGKFMAWFFPVFSLIICLDYNAGFALYWVASNAFSLLQTLVINRILDSREKNEASLTI